MLAEVREGRQGEIMKVWMKGGGRERSDKGLAVGW